MRFACPLLAIGCLPELAFDARELTLQSICPCTCLHWCAGMLLTDNCDQLCLVLVIA
jgi:hypothetical protein